MKREKLILQGCFYKKGKKEMIADQSEISLIV